MAIGTEKPFILKDGSRFGTKKEVLSERPGNIPHISRLLALAMRYDKMIRERSIPDFNTLAKLVGVTRPRMTQIMNLVNLSPDIQTAILTLPTINQSRGFFTERKLRPIAKESDWTIQRAMWKQLK